MPETEIMLEQYQKEFDGVFRFTNATDEDFKFFWNSKEYLFPAGKMTPMIIANETLESIQEIRKMAAYKLAVREFYRGNIKDDVGNTYTKLSKMGNGLPPVFDEKILESTIETCLKPLPAAKSTVKDVVKRQPKFKASKAIGERDNPNFVFKDEEVQKLGKMSDQAIM